MVELLACERVSSSELKRVEKVLLLILQKLLKSLLLLGWDTDRTGHHTGSRIRHNTKNRVHYPIHSLYSETGLVGVTQYVNEL